MTSAEEIKKSVMEKVDVAKEKLAEAYDEAKAKGVDFYNQSSDVLRERAKLVDDRVHNNPWPVIAGAFVSGFILGVILKRR